jgi:hypothetical protein
MHHPYEHVAAAPRPARWHDVSVVSNPGDQDYSDGLHGAIRDAAQRINPKRRRITLDNAEDVLRRELERHGVAPLSPSAVTYIAKNLHRGQLWPLLHPIQAHREGGRWRWRWSKD